MSTYDGAYEKLQVELHGRHRIYTDAREITESNIISVLQDALGIHEKNRQEIAYLLNYEKGDQPLKREKKIRSDIDIKVADNIANQITEFKTAYNYGNVITFVARGTTDSGIIDDEPSAITLFNECYESEFVREISLPGIFLKFGRTCHKQFPVKNFRSLVYCQDFAVGEADSLTCEGVFGISFRGSGKGRPHQHVALCLA